MHGEILQQTSARLKSRQKRITKGELFKAIGLLYALTLDVRRQHWDYWATASADDLSPTPAFGVRFGMVGDHNEQILAALSFGPADDGTDPLLPARALINIHLCICPTSATWSAVLCILFEQFYLNPNFYLFLLPRAKMSCQTSQKVPILSISKIWVHVMTFCLNVLPEALPAGQEGFLKAQSWDHFSSWHTQSISRIVYDIQPSVTNLQTTLH